MPFELLGGPPVTPEQMSEALDKNPMTREVITKIFSDGVGILFCSSGFKASVSKRIRNEKVVPGFWEIKVNLQRHKTKKDVEVSILEELLELGNALVDVTGSFSSPKYVFASSNPEFIDSTLKNS